MYIVAHNLTAMNAQRQFGINKKNRAKLTEKLASGYRINRAADDAAGLAISEKNAQPDSGIITGFSECAGWNLFDTGCRWSHGRSACHVTKGNGIVSSGGQ